MTTNNTTNNTTTNTTTEEKVNNLLNVANEANFSKKVSNVVVEIAKGIKADDGEKPELNESEKVISDYIATLVEYGFDIPVAGDNAVQYAIDLANIADVEIRAYDSLIEKETDEKEKKSLEAEKAILKIRLEAYMNTLKVSKSKGLLSKTCSFIKKIGLKVWELIKGLGKFSWDTLVNLKDFTWNTLCDICDNTKEFGKAEKDAFNEHIKPVFSKKTTA